MEISKSSNISSLAICIFLLGVLFIFAPSRRAHAAPFPSLKNAPIEELKLAAEQCSPDQRAKFSLSVHPPAFQLMPNQKVLISWWVNNQKGERWVFPVYLRAEGEEEGKEVSPIWMETIKSSDLPEGLNTYYLTTYCGVARMDIAKALHPEVTDYPISVTSGDTIHITGRNFKEWAQELYREVIIVEQGTSRTLEIEEWSDTEITATLPNGLYTGRQKFYVVSGRTKKYSRRSEELPMIVSNKEVFPSLTMASLLEDIFSEMDIHINNYGSQKSGSRYMDYDAYISFNKDLNTERFHLELPEYNLSAEPSLVAYESYEVSPYSYYINDINMDYVDVTKTSDGWSMTFYFENIDDEFIGIDTENTDIRAYAPENKRPLNIQLDDFKVVMDFDLIAINGKMVISPKNVESFGKITGTGTSCFFNDRDMCKELTENYESELLGQLSEILEITLSEESTRILFSNALEPWLASYSMGEVIEVSHDNDDIIMDFLPKKKESGNSESLLLEDDLLPVVNLMSID